MKASDINLKQVGYNMSCNIHPKGTNYKESMNRGNAFPCSKAQARYFNSNKLTLDAMNGYDVLRAEQMLNKHGFEGKYRYTKSKSWVRLQNHDDLRAALKKEYID